MIVWVSLVASLLVVLFLSRSVYQFLSNGSIERDAYAHMLYTEDIRANGHRLPERPSKVVTGGRYSYPFLMHWVLSFLPRPTVTTVSRYFSGLMDVCFAGFFLVLFHFDYLSIPETVLALLLFVTTPEFMPPNRSDGMGLSGRKPGLLVTTGALLAFSVWTTTGTTQALLLGILLSAFVYLASKFSLQALVFVALTFGVAGHTLVTASVFVALPVAILISGGEYWKVFRGHVRHLYEFATVLQYRISYTDPRSRTLSLLQELDDIRDLLELLYRSKIVRPLTFNPVIPLLGLMYALWFDAGTPKIVDPWVHAWILGGVGAFVLTSLPYLRFLGQPERYLQYVALPAILLVVKARSAFGPLYDYVLGFTIILGLVTIVSAVFAYLRVFSTGDAQSEFDVIISWLSDQNEGTVLIQPLWRGREIAWKTKHRVVDFVMNGGSTKAVTEERDRLFPGNYGRVTSETAWISKTYDPDWVVFDESETDTLVVDELHPPDAEPAFTAGRFSVYDFESVT